jgi:hypothetical protein
LNKNRVKTEFSVGDYVFVKDMQQVPGKPRTLKTKLSPSPYVVLRVLWTTTLVRRLADNFVTLYHNSMLKKIQQCKPIL